MAGLSAPNRASCNYAVGGDGRVALLVREGDASWCSSSSANDGRAVTIEVANTSAREPFPVSDAAMESLFMLCADICVRNGIRRLLWCGDESLVGRVGLQNMTVHRWFANKSCPGVFLFERMGLVAAEVNWRLALRGVKDLGVCESYLGVCDDVFDGFDERLKALESDGGALKRGLDRSAEDARALALRVKGVEDCALPRFQSLEDLPVWGDVSNSFGDLGEARCAVRDALGRGVLKGVGDGRLGLSLSDVRQIVMDWRGRMQNA
jgi:hypothetical protein